MSNIQVSCNIPYRYNMCVFDKQFIGINSSQENKIVFWVQILEVVYSCIARWCCKGKRWTADGTLNERTNERREWKEPQWGGRKGEGFCCSIDGDGARAVLEGESGTRGIELSLGLSRGVAARTRCTSQDIAFDGVGVRQWRFVCRHAARVCWFF